MPSDATATIHNFTLKKYSKFDHNTWTHHPYRTDLSITFIEPAHLATTKEDIVVIVYWKGSPIDKYTLLINGKVKTSILAKSPSIGIKQTVVSSGDLMFRFQISLVDDVEFEKCHELLKKCTFQLANRTEGYKNNGLDNRKEMGELNTPLNYNSQFPNQKSCILLPQHTVSNTAHDSQILEMDLQQPSQHIHHQSFDLQLQHFSQQQQQQQPQLLMLLQQVQPPTTQGYMQQQKFTCSQPTQSAQSFINLPPNMYSRTTQPIQNIQGPCNNNSQLQQHTQSQISLQQLQQQFLQWQQQNQQNLASTQLPQFVQPNTVYTQSPTNQPPQTTLPIQNQPTTLPLQSSTQTPNTSVSSIDPTPFIAINDLNDSESLTDAELSELITKQCHLAQFRAFVKRLDKILENKRQNVD